MSTEKWTGADDVDHAAGVASHAFHHHREVAHLPLHVINKRAMHLQQRCGLRVAFFKSVEAMLQGCIPACPCLVLPKRKSTVIVSIRMVTMAIMSAVRHTETYRGARQKLQYLSLIQTSRQDYMAFSQTVLSLRSGRVWDYSSGDPVMIMWPALCIGLVVIMALRGFEGAFFKKFQ